VLLGSEAVMLFYVFISASIMQVEGEGNEEMLSCVGGRSFRSVRERWWYIALSKCGVSADTINSM